MLHLQSSQKKPMGHVCHWVWAFKKTMAPIIGEDPLQDSSVHAFYLHLVAKAIHMNPRQLPRRIMRVPLTLP